MSAGRTLILMVLDSVGVGELPDAAAYGDEGADTLGHLAAYRRLSIPNLEALGLGCIKSSVAPRPARPLAAYGRMGQKAHGKDSITGHWEIAGLIAQEPFRTYPGGFPEPVLAALRAATGRDFIGNRAASGTEIVAELGSAHVASGRPILYTSADPVLQIAAHEGVIPPADLHLMCQRAFPIAQSAGLSRVIARPFTGPAGGFVRTANRRDFAVEPPRETILDRLQEMGHLVAGVGKVGQLFAGRGFSSSVGTASNDEGMSKVLEILHEIDRGLVFANLVDFDTKYGHRRDPEGYAGALERLDARLPTLLGALGEGDLLVLTADHGNDPTFHGTDHTREYVPLLVYGYGVKGGEDLATRSTFADVAASVAEFFAIEWAGAGTSFLGAC